MLTEEQYKIYYDFIINNISKLKQTYKYIDEYFTINNISYLTNLLSTWEFDDKWIKNNMSEKIKDEENKEIIREEFYNNLISNIDFTEQELSQYNICGLYSLNTTISYKISTNQSIQKLEGRKAIIDSSSTDKKIIIVFFLVYHMLIIENLIEDKGLCLTTEELRSEFNDNLDIINLCKICTKDILIKEEPLIESNLPIWFINNYKKYKAHQ